MSYTETNFPLKFNYNGKIIHEMGPWFTLDKLLFTGMSIDMPPLGNTSHIVDILWGDSNDQQYIPKV